AGRPVGAVVLLRVRVRRVPVGATPCRGATPRWRWRLRSPTLDPAMVRIGLLGGFAVQCNGTAVPQGAGRLAPAQGAQPRQASRARARSPAPPRTRVRR